MDAGERARAGHVNSAHQRRSPAWRTTVARAVAVLTCLTVLAWPGEARAQLTIRLRSIPAATPDTATIFVAGSFNRWEPGAEAFALRPHSAGGWAITLPATIRGAIEFKFTLGSWERVETSAAGEDVPNRVVTVPDTGATTLTVAVAGWRSGTHAGSASPNVRILGDSVPIPQLGRSRRVWIYLPPGYDSSDARYPVLYMHDGQNVFDIATSYAGEWGVDETLDSLSRHGDRGVIVVAIDHGGDRRLNEYNPWVHPRHGGGEGNAYVDFLVHTLKPHIDSRYRTLSAPEQTGIIGSSMGGLISLYAALRHPDVFGRAGVFSCACWIARPHIYAFAREAAARAPDTRFYFVAGALETPDGGPARDQEEMVDTLLAAGAQRSPVIRSRVVEDGTHTERFWRREFPAVFRWLFQRDEHTPDRSRQR